MSVKKSRILRIVTVSTLIMMLLLCFSVSVVPTSATTGDTVSSPLVVESVDEERLAFVNEICIELNSYLYDNVVYPKGSGSFGGSYIDWDSEALVIQLSDYSAVSIYEDALPGAEETVIRPLLEKVIQCGYDWADRYKDHEFIRFEAVKYSYAELIKFYHVLVENMENLSLYSVGLDVMNNRITVTVPVNGKDEVVSDLYAFLENFGTCLEDVEKYRDMISITFSKNKCTVTTTTAAST